MTQSILRYKKNINSQNGEDGIIEYIFNTMGITKGNFIEFGAWDGKHLSNCYKLFNEGWSGIFIEADAKKFNDLQSSFGHYNDRLTLINKMVGYHSNDNLDIIIETSGHSTKEFDFVSIDVDGLDYNIFKYMQKYLPKVICIEVNAGHSPMFNKEIPIEIAKENIGQSMTVICLEAEKKGYFPICYTGNLFLIKNEYKLLFQEHIKSITDIYIDFLDHLPKDDLEYLLKHFYGKNIFVR